MKKCNKDNKGRILIKNIVFILILLSIFGFFTNIEFGKKQIKTQAMTVQKEDTIWSIANNICKNNEKLNIQNVIIEIKQINDLSNSDIYIGQILNIPVY